MRTAFSVLAACLLAAAAPPSAHGQALKVGDKVSDSQTALKVIQVIDDSSMLISIQVRNENLHPWSGPIMLKCPTGGIVDGTIWQPSSWPIDTPLYVTGTTRYKTTDGGSKTVFVLEKKP